MYGGPNKEKVCFQTVKVRNRKNSSLEINAVIVDFCPTRGCLWPMDELSYNVDIYGEMTWTMLGAGFDQGVMEIEVQV
jgi:hypothetical protein